MYFPYLYGRQSELRALQAANLKYCKTGKVIPVIEPVVQKPNDLIRCVEQLGQAGTAVIVTLNPNQGDFKAGASASWLQALDGAIAKHLSVIPALKCGPQTSIKFIEGFLAKYAGRNVALMYSNPSLTDAEIAKLTGISNVVAHICLQGKMTGVQRTLLPIAKAVDIVDSFNKQPRNADYSGIEPFTDRHKNYSTTGVGFGDYTVTGNLFLEGGGKVAAVALHATYKHPVNKDIWVEHFVSDDVDINTGSAASKYLEAATKLAAAAALRKNEFGVNDALIDYATDLQIGHYPGLGKSKQRQIYHHIAVVHDILHGKL
jgi:hypothetical protein